MDIHSAKVKYLKYKNRFLTAVKSWHFKSHIACPSGTLTSKTKQILTVRLMALSQITIIKGLLWFPKPLSQGSMAQKIPTDKFTRNWAQKTLHKLLAKIPKAKSSSLQNWASKPRRPQKSL